MCVVVEVGLRYISVGRNVADDKQQGVFFQEDKSNPTDSGGPLKKEMAIFLSFPSFYLYFLAYCWPRAGGRIGAWESGPHQQVLNAY